MLNIYTNLINSYKTLAGKMAGADYSYSVIRPPYTPGDNSGIVVTTMAAQVEAAGPNWAQDKIPDAEFYVVCGDPSLFQSGDVLDCGANIPVVTVFSKPDGQEFLAVKTDKTCHISDINLEWTNLKFDYMNSTSAGPEEFLKEPTSLNVSTRRVVMYDVPGVTEAMKLFDDDSGWNWSIAKVDRKFGVMELFLDEPNRT